LRHVKQRDEPAIELTVSGGHIQGIAGAGSVVIENFTIYNRAAEEPATNRHRH
jgi:hypothetical protein